MIQKIISALKSEWLYAIGTLCLVAGWSTDKWLVKNEEAYFDYFNAETTGYFQKMNELRFANLQKLLVELHKDKFESPWRRQRDIFRAKMENAMATNQMLAAVKTRANPNPDSAIMQEYTNRYMFLQQIGSERDSVKLDSVQFSLESQFNSARQLENILGPELESMQTVMGHGSNLGRYRAIYDVLFVLGTMLIALNTFKKYWGKKQEAAILTNEHSKTLSAVLHTVKEIKKDITKQPTNNKSR